MENKTIFKKETYRRTNKQTDNRQTNRHIIIHTDNKKIILKAVLSTSTDFETRTPKGVIREWIRVSQWPWAAAIRRPHRGNVADTHPLLRGDYRTHYIGVTDLHAHCSSMPIKYSQFVLNMVIWTDHPRVPTYCLVSLSLRRHVWFLKVYTFYMVEKNEIIPQCMVSWSPNLT